LRRFIFKSPNGKKVYLDIKCNSREEAKMIYKQEYLKGNIKAPINVTVIVDVEQERKLFFKEKEINKVIEDIYQDFNVEIRFLDRPSSLEEARRYYEILAKRHKKEESR
jgi:hypothetical protein